MSLPSVNSGDQPHLVSLVLQSKKALQHGEQVCSRAHARYNASAQEAIDVLALDAKVRWVTDAILEQLKLAAGVAKCIEEKRLALSKTVQVWDASRAKSTDALESILESLGQQVVPPNFHETSSGSSLFGSQHSDEEDERLPFVQPQSPKRVATGRKPLANALSVSPVSPSATIRRNGSLKGRASGKAEDTAQPLTPDRAKWKTLRDFVDERAIEEIFETIESDRNRLEDVLNRTDDYSDSLHRTIESLRESLPQPESIAIISWIQQNISGHDEVVASMAEKLESLASHYDQMAGALKDSEAGEAFAEEDLRVMNRDTDELPVIMGELDDSEKDVTAAYDALVTARRTAQQNLNHLTRVLNDLDELGDIMGDMLQTQDEVEVECEEFLGGMNLHLETLDHLHQRYILYQTAFNKLLIEIARRRHYKTSVEQFVKSMQDQLDSMVYEEGEVRKHFNAQYGAHLPEDICLCIANEPTRWEVQPAPGDRPEILPFIDPDLLVKASELLEPSPMIPVGPESL